MEALWKAYPKVPQSANLVMFWWEKATLTARGWNAKTGKGTRQSGLIATNSLRQTFNCRVLGPHLSGAKKPLSLLVAVPDHPWVDTQFGAAVWIAMTVGVAGNRAGKPMAVTSESMETKEAEGHEVTFDMRVGKVFANLQIGADMAGATALLTNDGLSSPDVKLHGAGFIVTPEKAMALGLGSTPGVENHIHDYQNGRDLMATSHRVMVIDLFGLFETHVRPRFPTIFQHATDNIKPERNQNKRDTYRIHWWIHGELRRDLRPILLGLPRYVATVENTNTGNSNFSMPQHCLTRC